MSTILSRRFVNKLGGYGLNFICLGLLVFVSGQSLASEPKQLNILYINTVDFPLLSESQKSYERTLERVLPNTQLNLVVKQADGEQAAAESEIKKALADGAHYDLIVASATLATRAMLKTADLHDIPMQFMLVSDPISEGIVENLGEQSKYNVTGLSHVVDTKTKLQLMNQILASANRKLSAKIGLLHSEYPASQTERARLLELQHNYPLITFVEIPFTYEPGDSNVLTTQNNIVEALTAFKPQIDGFWMPPGPPAHDLGLLPEIHQRVKIPQYFAEDGGVVAQGALFGVMTDAQIIGSSAAKLTAEILSQNRANDIPVHRIEKFIVALNISTAVQTDLVFPSELVKLASKNIYR